MFSIFQYDFIVNAVIIGLALALSASLLSPYLALNGQAMMADGLAHVSFTGIILGVLLANESLWIAIPFVVISSVLIKYLSSQKDINSDAAIGVVSATSFAIGLILVKKSSGFNISIESMVVGNILTISQTELILALVGSVLILGFILIFYRQLFLLTYDSEYARFSKVKVHLLNYLLAGLTSFFIVIGVRTIGTLLISALIIFPALIASQLTKSFKSTLISGSICSLVVVFSGIMISHPLETPVGSTIVVIYAILLLGSLLYKKVRRS